MGTKHTTEFRQEVVQVESGFSPNALIRLKIKGNCDWGKSVPPNY